MTALPPGTSARERERRRELQLGLSQLLGGLCVLGGIYAGEGSDDLTLRFTAIGVGLFCGIALVFVLPPLLDAVFHPELRSEG